METRNLNRPSYVLALLLGVTAVADAANALIAMQMPDLCKGLPSQFNTIGISCGNSGWVIDLASAGISAGLLAFLLIRPHLYVFGATAGWGGLAFISNFALRHTANAPDVVATYRMTIYFLVLVVAGVLLALELQAKLEADRAKRPAAPVAPPWPAGTWPGAGPFVAPPYPPAAPAAPLTPTAPAAPATEAQAATEAPAAPPTSAPKPPAAGQ
ncbi:MAG: hypothetical protein ABSE70_10110 [Candidatus Limnocylindrales bacterium]